MPEKNVGGRPRKYASDAERKKAYRERKKQKMEMLEERVVVLEKLLEKYQIDFDSTLEEIEEKEEIVEPVWMKLTPGEIGNLDNKQINDYLSAYEKQHDGLPLSKPLKDILLKSGIKLKLDNKEIQKGFSELEESIQRLILAYLMKAELDKRKRIDEGVKELELLKRDITDLEKEIEKPKIKKTVKSQWNHL